VTEYRGDTPSRQCPVDPRRHAGATDPTTRMAQYVQGFRDGETDCGKRGYEQI